MAGLVASIHSHPGAQRSPRAQCLALSADTRILSTDDSLVFLLLSYTLHFRAGIGREQLRIHQSILPSHKFSPGFEHRFSMCTGFNGSSTMTECQTDREQDQVC